MTSRSYLTSDQDRFAELSGDFNPLHVDPVHARRLMFGAAAVHGVHNLLWSLEVWAANGEGPVTLQSVNAAFTKPVAVGTTVRCATRSSEPTRERLQLFIGDDVVAKVDFTWAPAENGHPAAESGAFTKQMPDEHSEYAELSGQLPLIMDSSLATEMFPNLMRRCSPRQIAALLASTKMVGMHCPGLHSVFSELNIKFTPEAAASGFAYRVTRHDPRFSMLSIELSGEVAGSVTAFVRPKPRDQASFANLSALVSASAFAGQRAVVVGGSRGLGEVVAKLLAAGGAEVMITYHQGATDAAAICDEINQAGGKAASCAYNVLLASDTPHETLSTWGATHLYYFATPHISTGKRGRFSMPLYEKFSAYYAGGLSSTLNVLGVKQLKAVYCPSSVFIDTPPDTLLEYSAAKATAEFVCSSLQKQHGMVYQLFMPRLPKMDTDQTASFGEASGLDPSQVMAQSLLDIHLPVSA
ncbi:SDR family NAD(P)-dependent oxidoreductase [Pseudomethylobacillus aquaticus]|uniref:SDR family NAD(P)-dependent oxidoreductase n=1 Tax=Pseudomethylobacillus aquaticus TaxID=2676064 RepID=A0A3N0V2T0_9PROT|nr:SDR family NAD(P)-dependent oxidoreductase [Pseudomethylobacillus aquaticus]ROH87090.1 SDR family NAD(P)-dependent oxidoreductase [Pseudomethylobacillus aquaticus]